MVHSLKSYIQALSQKYSWHTLGDKVAKRKVTKLENGLSISEVTISDHMVFKPNTKSKKLIAQRAAVTQQLYKQYNVMAFDSLLPADLPISWSNRLTSTAGMTKMSAQSINPFKRLHTEIILSEKVLDDIMRLKSTLLHEMCHAAAYIIDGERKPPHGACFWKWASICSANIPGMVVTTCHSYAIHKPYQFQCVDCQKVYGRHSKRGVDIIKHCCGVCKGKLEFTGIFNSDGTPKPSRVQTPKTIKKTNPEFQMDTTTRILILDD
mmetsp:Transcript_24918/g.23913  ORF Transcript_24918/g.23913 Transcript_24918/m.23913 type:complete len:265 (-) Transcript_24918:284-1078(-)